MPAPVADTIVLGGINPTMGNVVAVPTHAEINEKIRLTLDDSELSKEAALVVGDEIKPLPQYDGDEDDHDHDKESVNEDAIIITGADAAQHLLPMRDDGDPSLTFRALFLASGLAAFQAVMTQIYNVS